MHLIKLKRVYDPPEASDGARFLVERLWPRGMTKERAKLDAWLKDLAPSPELRTWFSHEPTKWPEFRKRYFSELKKNPAALGTLRDAAKKGPVTLVFAARESELSCAQALKEYLEKA